MAIFNYFSEYRWSEEVHDDIFCLYVMLTNHHISCHLFCNDAVANHFQCNQNRNYIIGDKIAKKRKMCQKNILIIVAHALSRIL